MQLTHHFVCQISSSNMFEQSGSIGRFHRTSLSVAVTHSVCNRRALMLSRCRTHSSPRGSAGGWSASTP